MTARAAMFTTSVTAPATSMVRPVADGGPSKNGMNPRLSESQLSSPTEAGPRTAMPP
jgi:hypothetical protein